MDKDGFHSHPSCIQKMRELGQFYIELRPFSKHRSARQERFYRGVILPMIRKFEMDARNKTFTLGDVHNYVKVRILGRTENVELLDGTFQESIISNADPRNTTLSWEEEMERIRAHYAEKGLVLPLPHELID
jgi:hypothetical protein